MKSKVVAIILFSVLFIAAVGCKKDNSSSSNSQYTTAPVIVLKGEKIQPWELNQSPYVDPGDTAYDKIDGNLTGSVVITGTVITTIEGTYTRYYNVKDKGGLSAVQQIRTVIVEPFK